MNLSNALAHSADQPVSVAALAAVGSRDDAQVPKPIERLDIGELLQFKAMMQAEGQSVQVARMFYDRLYAYERIACAHASGNDLLRRVALSLFQACHRHDEARGVAN